MATERAAKLFPTAGVAHRYCQSHGLDISMVNDQLWDIAEALYDATHKGASKELDEHVRLIDDLSSSFLSMAGEEGRKLSVADQEMLKKADEAITRSVVSGETSGFTPESIVEWAQDIEDRHGLENQAGNVEELLADAILEAWEWIRVNKRGQHPTSVPPELHQKVLDASNLIVKQLPGLNTRKELDGLQDVLTWLRDNQ